MALDDGVGSVSLGRMELQRGEQNLPSMEVHGAADRAGPKSYRRDEARWSEKALSDGD